MSFTQSKRSKETPRKEASRHEGSSSESSSSLGSASASSSLAQGSPKQTCDARSLVSFVVPCYNSAAYMRRSIESLLADDHDFEVLLINDGSTDDTENIAREYETRDSRVKLINQNNRNWGGAINHGLELARGIYFKVLDSDDYFDTTALKRVLDTLESTLQSHNAPDLLITNYVYDHIGHNSQRLLQYRSFFPSGRVISWDEIKFSKREKIYQDKFIMIHAAWYKTELLHAARVQLEEGVSYMDSILLLRPLPLTETLFYLDVAPYHYIIGREGQSVEIDIVKKHINEQILACTLAIDGFDYARLYQEMPYCAMLMTGYVSCMMSVSTIHLFKIGTKEALQKNRDLWAYLLEKSPELYSNVRKSWAGRTNRKTALGRLIALFGYGIAQRIYKFA